LIGAWTSTGNFSNSIAIGQGTRNSAAQEMNLGGVLFATGIRTSNTATAGFVTGGRVGIGTATPERTFHVAVNAAVAPIRVENSNGYCEINPTTTTWSCTSDARLKNTIIALSASSTLQKVATLRPVSFKWNNQSDDTQRFGLIAQEVEAVFPELVSTDTITGYKSVAYGNLTPFIISALQEVNVKVDALAAEVAMMKAQIGAQNSLVSVAGTTVTILKDLVVDNLTVGSASKPSGITLYDETTGAPTCLRVRNGQTITTAGACSVINPIQPITPPVGPGNTSTTTPTTTDPIIPPTPTSTPTTTEPIIPPTPSSTPATTDPVVPPAPSEPSTTPSTPPTSPEPTEPTPAPSNPTPTEVPPPTTP
jgi:hypothetical protein